MVSELCNPTKTTLQGWIQQGQRHLSTGYRWLVGRTPGTLKRLHQTMGQLIFSLSPILDSNHIVRCFDTQNSQSSPFEWRSSFHDIRTSLERTHFYFELVVNWRICQPYPLTIRGSTLFFVLPLELQVSKCSTNLSMHMHEQAACRAQRPDERTCESQTSVFASASMARPCI